MERQPAEGDRHEAAQHEQADPRHEQRFRLGPWVFNIDRAQEIIAEHPRPAHSLPVLPWTRAYGLDRDDRQSVALIGPGPDFDREYAMTTDLTEPVIVAIMRSQETGEVAPLLIDGTHRLYRAYEEGLDVLPVYVLNTEESLAIREDAHYR